MSFSHIPSFLFNLLLMSETGSEIIFVEFKREKEHKILLIKNKNVSLFVTRYITHSLDVYYDSASMVGRYVLLPVGISALVLQNERIPYRDFSYLKDNAVCRSRNAYVSL